MHAIVLFKTEKEKRNLRRALETVFQMSQSEKKVFSAVRRKWGQLREALHGAYNHDYYANYLHKDGTDPKKGFSVSEVVDDNWVPEAAEDHYVDAKDTIQVNGKFHELYAHYNGEKNLAAWVDKLVFDDVIDYSFIPINGKKEFLRMFGGWATSRGRYQEVIGHEEDSALDA